MESTIIKKYIQDSFQVKVAPRKLLSSRIIITTIQIHLEEEEGDILLFLTGQEEIES